MSILGARLALAAREALGPQPPGVHFSARFAHQTCALDGIQLATHCTPGNNNLEITPLGEHHLTLWVQEGGATVSARLTEAALDFGRTYGDLRRRRGALDPTGGEAAALAGEMEQLLAHLEEAPAALLVHIEPSTAPAPQ